MTLQVWSWWLAGAALGGAGVFLVCWGLFSDRLSGNWKKRRCRKCLYDMTSVSGLKCPECGREWGSEAQLRNVRRRWGLAGFGLVLTLGAFALNWYATGIALGWQSVAPSAVLIRLSPVIGRQAALRAVVGTGTMTFPNAVPIEQASSWTLAATEQVAIAVLEDKDAPFREVWAAVDALFWMRDHVRQPQKIAMLLTQCPPGRMMPQYTWSNSLYAIIANNDVVLDPAKIADAASAIGSNPGEVASRFLSEGLSPRVARLVPDLLARGGHNQVTWPQLEGVTPEVKAALLKRLREVYFAGDELTKQRITSFLFPNGKMMPAGNADFEAVARDQIARMRRGEDTDFLVENSFITWQVSEALSGLAPELGDLLSSPKLYARERASDVLKRIEASAVNSPAISNAVLAAIRDGTDDARQMAISIAWRRRDIDRGNVIRAILESAGKVSDPITMDAMYRFVVPATVEGVRSKALDQWANSEASADLQRILVERVQSDGPCAAVSAVWISRLPVISPETTEVLRAAMEDGSRSAETRIAARNALLQIRDRLRPEVDPAMPLEITPTTPLGR